MHFSTSGYVTLHMDTVGCCLYSCEGEEGGRSKRSDLGPLRQDRPAVLEAKPPSSWCMQPAAKASPHLPPQVPLQHSLCISLLQAAPRHMGAQGLSSSWC